MDMFIFTTKFNKKKAIVAVLVLAAILIAIILIAASNDRANAEETAALSAVVKNNDQRINYLKALGWEVDKTALEEQNIVIPRDFSDVYKKYNEIQLAQGFDLSKYGGIEATRYTYKVLNFPGTSGNVVADIIVYRNEIIAGDVQSNALDGFMVGLEFPSSAAPETAAPGVAETEATDPDEQSIAQDTLSPVDTTAEALATADAVSIEDAA